MVGVPSEVSKSVGFGFELFWDHSRRASVSGLLNGSCHVGSGLGL